MSAIKDAIIITCHYTFKKWIIWISQDTFQNVHFFNFHCVHVESTYRVFSPCQFSWDGPYVEMLIHIIWYISLEHWHGYYSNIFSDVNCHMQLYVYYDYNFQDSYPPLRYSENSAVQFNDKWILLCSAKVGISVRNIMAKVDFMQSIKRVYSFFMFKMSCR